MVDSRPPRRCLDSATVAIPIRAVLFDWGDTLFASPRAAEVIVAAARERGVHVDPEDARALWDELWALGKTPEEHAKGRDLGAGAHREVWTSLFKRADHVFPGLAETLYDRVMEPSSWTPYPDTASTLRALKKRGLRIGIVSNIPRDLRPFFAREGLGDVVDAFTLSFEHGITKPDPEIFLIACEQVRSAPAETLMVGDDEASDGGALAAGLRVLILPPPPAQGPRGLDAVLRVVNDARA